MIGRTNSYNLAGGEGASLNFKVVGNPQPSNPSDNTIWVNTDVKITGWIFSATQPDNLTEGNVWISTGTSSPTAFNALQKNGIMVYPVSAKQYINGALVDKTAKTYQDGAWVDWIVYTYLFKSGTGKVVEFTTKHQGNCSIAVTTEKITVTAANPASNGQSVVFTSAKHDVSGKKTLNALIYCDKLAGNIQPKFGLSNSIPNFDSYSYVASVSIQSNSRETVYSIDLSSVTSGSYYIGTGGAFNGYIKDMWMEE